GELAARLVVADDAYDADAGAESGQVVGHVAGAARDKRLLRDPHHGNGGLGGDAADRTADVLVEHEIADDEDALVSKPFYEALQCARAGGGGWHDLFAVDYNILTNFA